ncbi:MAG: metalloregulator ArsR/SmtB family transcription factor [Kofleriaceae bacterium]
MTTLDDTLAALADPTRRAVIDTLRRGPRRAGELAAHLGVSAPALSRHLRVLRRAGVVTDDAVADDARVRVYRLEPQPFADVRGWLDEVEAFWVDQLAAFKAHAERTAAPAPHRAAPRRRPRGGRA